MCVRTGHVVVHPIEHDLWGSVPPRGHVAGHLVVRVPRQTKVQDLRDKACNLNRGPSAGCMTEPLPVHMGD